MIQTNLLANHYTLKSLIGRGGMGDVYLGQDNTTGQAVALKVLHPSLGTSADLLQRFTREGEALRELNHPNIVKVWATFVENEQHYIVMEYVGAGSLRDLLDKTPQLPIPQVLSISLGLADALTRAHHLRIIHRDLKPANVLLAEDGTPRLTDFGVALMGNRTRITEAGAVTGTYAYLSPEACRGEELDGRTDIWALGVMMYEMVAGRLPFDSEHGAAVLLSIMTRPMPSLSQFRPDAPSRVVDLISRMLAKEREQRPSSIRLIGAELEAIIQGYATPTRLTHTPMASRFRTPTPILGELSEMTPVRHNLSPESTPFMGRQEELMEIHKRLMDANCRLLTLLGPGGIGKTRLALQTAFQSLPNYPDGVYFVPLAAVTAPDFLLSAIADSLKLEFFRPTNPQENVPSPKEQLINFLRAKQMLLVMDNFEQLLGGVSLFTELLAQAPGLKLLVTSRERLNVQVEWVLRLEGLLVPTATTAVEELETFAAVQLFVSSAQRISGHFELTRENQTAVAQICRLVDGMPLGIELAAAWVQMLPPEEIAQEIQNSLDFLETNLRDVPDRHRSLRAVFEYSWQSLTPREQETLQKLSVFRGGFMREAAVKIANASLPILTVLVNKSLLGRLILDDSQNSIRYQIHELLRQYAAEKLAERTAVQTEVMQAYAQYYAQFLVQKYHAFYDINGQQALREIENELENMRATWLYAVNHRDEAIIEQMAQGLGTLYLWRNWFDEGLEMFRQATAVFQHAAPQTSQELLKGRLLLRQGEFAQGLQSARTVEAFYSESLAIFRRHQTKPDEAQALSHLAGFYGRNGLFEKAKAHYQEALEIYRQLEDWTGVARACFSIAQMENDQGEHGKAKELLTNALFLAKREEAGLLVADILNAMGTLYYRTSLADELEKVAQEALAIYETYQNEAGKAQTIRLIAMAEILRGNYAQAQEHNRRSLAIYQRIRNPWGQGVLFNNMSHMAFFLNQFEEMRFFAQQSIAIYERLQVRWGLSFPLVNLARAELALGHARETRSALLKAGPILYDMQALHLILSVLSSTAKLWLLEGHPVEAFAMLFFARTRPDFPHDYQVETDRLLKEWQALLSAETIAQAQTETASWEILPLLEKLLAGEFMPHVVNVKVSEGR